jgi:membrane protein DedA with SNARE-associated domain
MTARRSRPRVIANTLWIAAGVTVAIGFLLRPVARYVIGHELRIAAMVVIAIGVVTALIAWAAERLARTRAGTPRAQNRVR